MAIKVDDPVAFAQISLMVQRAKHHLDAEVSLELSVEGTLDAGYAVYDNGDLYARVDTLDAVLDAVYMRIYRRAMELASLKGWLRVHGAVASLGARRVAVVGAGAAGKTTLSIGLLELGANVECDESFLTRNAQVVGVARRFHIKPGTLELMADSAWLRDVPTVGSLPVRVLDPSEHGFGWDLPVGPITDLIALRRTDEASRIEGSSAQVLVQEIIAQVFAVLEPRRVIVREAARLGASARCHVLYAGPDGVAPHLVKVLVTPPRVP